MRIVNLDDSSHITQIAYNLETQVMHVRFLSGMVYRYDKVHPDVFGQIVSADSVGAAFSELVKFNPSIPYLAVEEMPVIKNATV